MSAFSGAGSKPGMEVWRIESLTPRPVPILMHGVFYEGDAYICLKTTAKPRSSALVHDIFFWLGKECTHDEQGVAAYKAVELDDALGGGPTQHRETQGHESEQFMQCFRSVQYRKGGVASGFKHVAVGVYETRLLHLKGAKTVRVTVVPMRAASLNAGDVFVLDLGLSLIQWNGAEANRREKAKALDVVADIRNNERGGRATVSTCEQGEEPDEFWTALGGRGPVAAAVCDSTPSLARGELRLIRVSDASGAMTTTEVGRGRLQREMLTSEDVFIMDNAAEIVVWVGKRASAAERRKGMEFGTAFCSEGGRPEGTRVSKVMEGTEPTTFKANFATWDERVVTAPVDFSRASSCAGGNIAKGPRHQSSEELAASMIEGAKGDAIDALSASVDTSNGETAVWRIEGFEKVAIEASKVGQFYAGDSYLVRYSYQAHGKTHYLIYFWLGSQSSADEKGAAAILAAKMDDELGGAATQVRVTMGKEPSHFVKIFRGRLVIHSGGKASGFKNRADRDSYDVDGISLYHIRGTSQADTRAVQVDEKAENLNAGDCFVLLTPSRMFVWCGSGANESERTTAWATAELLRGTRATEEVAEGSEPDEFWSAIGGKAEYPTAKWLPPPSRAPMLFCCSNATGAIKIEPIFNFSQSDLEEEDVFVLDTYTAIFVWVGSAANDKEKAAAESTASAYLQANQRDPATPILTVKSGAEPELFQANFLGWSDAKKPAFVDPYEAKLAALKAANPPPSPPKPQLSLRSSSSVNNNHNNLGAASTANGAHGGAADTCSPGGAKVAERSPPVLGARSLAQPQHVAVDVADLVADAAARGPMTDVLRFDPAGIPVIGASPRPTDGRRPTDGSYTLNYEELKRPAHQLPEGVDPRTREVYLSDDDFVKVLGSPRAAFMALKPWKQRLLKKAAGLD